MARRVGHEPMLRPKGMSHPSGRPIYARKFGYTPKPRIPSDEPLTPGLRTTLDTEAIGFVTEFAVDEADEDE